ncbi:HEAT repeat domain-containing protein [Nocardia cyriacigeorgica]|uniref:HEAT repeat domain-containing protein n=1 Tax=Nocardia cyriacigeorgica TaxID=135487 RepID=A0A5R8NAP6_9NOCA|nr:HEAT repeat domain-containing protein [Nocardia cyriacigeorgica]MBF6093981.1 hypothetical protein [Nocardia cyriacigeorgica]TLF72728.1 hypothetical protein FEK34_28755 [Nocardia cyriacigeorgica]TLF92380.1 hypothetical protein FEK35_30610 [Nocardia cyriacigeorgica]
MATDTDPPPGRDQTAQRLRALANQVDALADALAEAIDQVRPVVESTSAADDYLRWADAARGSVARLHTLRKRIDATAALTLAEQVATTAPPTPAAATDATSRPSHHADQIGEVELIHPPYPGMPDRPDWLDNPPPRLHDRQNGFDLRLVRDLAAVGVRTYTLSPITKLKPLPQAIPVFLDWLEHLDTKLPGPEHRGRRGTPEHHKAVIRAGLIRNLNDRSAKGNQRVINVLAAQLRTTPPLPDETRFWAGRALTTVCTKDDYDLITALIAEQPPGDTVIAGLLSYLGKMRTVEARTIILQHFDHPLTRNYAINALADMKATGVRPLIEPLLNDPDRFTRQTAARALRKLPTDS